MKNFPKPQKKRLRRTMMFLNAQRAGLVKDAYVYKPDCIIFDLEDAVAQNQKDSARFQLYAALTTIDYRGIERIVRINGIHTPFWKEDVRAAVACGCDGIRIPECETRNDVAIVEAQVEKAEKEFGREIGETMIMAAIETPLGVINAYELATSSPRIFGISIGAGDYMRTMHATRTREGAEMFVARGQLVIAARAAGVMCFDTVHTDIDDLEGLEKDTMLIRQMGYDGKSVISPKQISVIHKVFTPTEKEILKAENTVRTLREQAETGVGVISLEGQMVDVAMLEGAQRTIDLAKAAGVYRGDL